MRRLLIAAVLLASPAGAVEILQNMTGFESSCSQDGFDTATADQCRRVGSAPGIVTNARTGNYARNNQSGTLVIMDDEFTCSGSDCDNRLIGFAWMTTVQTVWGAGTILDTGGTGGLCDGGECFTLGWHSAGNTDAWALRDSTNTIKCTIENAVTAVDEWDYWEVYWQRTNTGNFEVFKNGVSQCSGTGDFLIGTAQDGNDIFGYNVEAPGFGSYSDDFYHLTGAASSAARLSVSATQLPEIFPFYSTTASDTENGDVLDAGQWDDSAPQLTGGTWVADQPEYTTTRSGSTDTNGPSGSADIDGDSNIKAVSYHFRLKRGTGGGTTHQAIYGNDVDGDKTETVTLETNYDHWQIVSVAADTMPLSTQNCRLGMDEAGNRDFHMDIAVCSILHVPDAAAARRRIVVGAP